VIAPLPSRLQLLNALRKLDCFKLEPQDMYVSGISAAVATLAARHPKPDVSRLATSLLQKWRDIVETALFQPQEYDAKAAAAAPDGESECPEDLIAAELEVARRERAERRRQRLEEDIMASDSEEDEIVPMSQEEDPDWAPIAGSKPGGKRSKSGWATRSRVSTRAQAGSGDDDGGGFHDVVVEDGAVDVAPIIVPEPPKTATMHPFFRNLLAAGKQPR